MAVITGTTGDDILTGTSGDDIIDGDTGADAMSGLDGDDIYAVDDAGDTVIENSGEGTDTVQAAVSFILDANIENLSLTGTDDIDGTGNDLDNAITGNSGVNILDGGLGGDTLTGGDGDDIYIVDDAGDTITESSGEGTDTAQAAVSFVLGADIENLILTGTGDIDGTGNDLDNAVSGNSGANILDGGLGADTLAGGDGDDTYMLDDAGDAVIENSSEGTDTVQVGFTYTLGADVENLILTGTDDIDGTGNDLDNTITGNSGVNTLDGGLGADAMSGGDGDDIYIVDDAGDTVTENSGEGTDTVQTAISFVLGADVENLTLTGTDDINGTGNGLDNVITGNDGANVLTGGLGNDTYDIGDGTGDSIVESTSAGTDTVRASVTWTLAANLENLVLTGGDAVNGTGNGLKNIITGNDANNTLNGGTNADTLIGGDGDDTYITDGGDTITENADEGTDLVRSSATCTLGANLENLLLTNELAINGTGNILDNLIIGNNAINIITGGSGNDTLDGRGGADKLYGGAGDDIYIAGTGDVITEVAGAGTDTVMSSIAWTLGAYLENLTLTGGAGIAGTGNSLANIITGNSGANILDGREGADTLIGGDRNDTYIVTAGDIITENANEGTDLVRSAITWTLGDNVENLTLIGSAAINGTGNDLDNIFIGNTGANVFTGGDGDDTYHVAAGDSVVESADEGIDSVISTVTFVMGANIENLTLISTGTINGTGNDLDNIIGGNIKNNILRGGDGDDTITGGGGADKLYGDAGDDNLTGSAGLDILDGGNGNDTIHAGAGKDTITGGAGDDLLYGQGGIDTIYGGTGADTFFFDSVVSASADLIKDFSTGEGDALDLSAILTAYDPLAHAIASFVKITVASGKSTLSVDTDGAATAHAWVSMAVIDGALSTDMAGLVASGNLIVD